MSTTTTTTTVTATRARPTTKQKVGLVLAGLYALGNLPSFLTAPPDGEEGPPMAILVVDSLLGLLGVVAVVMAWRGHRLGYRLAAGSMILITLTGLPAFFVDVPMFVKALVGASVLVTVVTVVLLFSGDRRPAPVVD